MLMLCSIIIGLLRLDTSLCNIMLRYINVPLPSGYLLWKQITKAQCGSRLVNVGHQSPQIINGTSAVYHQTSNIRHTKCQRLNVSCLLLQLSLLNPLKSGVKLRMKMLLEQHWQAMLQLHLSDQQFYCLLRCDSMYGISHELWTLSKSLVGFHVSFNSLWPSGATGWKNRSGSGTGDGMLPDCSKQLPESVLTYHQRFLLHSPESNFARIAHERNTNMCSEFTILPHLLGANNLENIQDVKGLSVVQGSSHSDLNHSITVSHRMSSSCNKAIVPIVTICMSERFWTISWPILNDIMWTIKHFIKSLIAVQTWKRAWLVF